MDTSTGVVFFRKGCPRQERKREESERRTATFGELSPKSCQQRKENGDSHVNLFANKEFNLKSIFYYINHYDQMSVYLKWSQS